jgi:hypothetical protein
MYPALGLALAGNGILNNLSSVTNANVTAFNNLYFEAQS